MSSTVVRHPRSLASWLAVLLGALVFVSVQGGPAAAKPDRKQEKINTYVGLLNKWTPIVSKSFEHYRGHIDLAAGPDCKTLRQELRLGTISASSTKELEKYAKAVKSKPALEIDAAVTRMVDALTALVEPLGEASEYYFKRTFRDDACKRGQELHPVLVAHWTEFLDAERELRAFVVAYNDKAALEALATAKKKYGTKFRYHFEKLLIDGKALVREVDAQSAQERPDVAAVRASVETFVATLEAAEKLVADAKGDKKLRQDLNAGGYEHFLGNCRRVASAGTFLLRDLERPASKSREQQLARRYQEIVTDYNAMIGRANKTRFSARIK